MTLKEKTDYLPFLITKNEAEQIFYQWLKTKYRRKKNLTTTYQIQSLAANYIPVYLITADASAHYGGTKTISKFNTESEEYEYDYIHLSDQVEIKIIYEMIYAISHTQILKLTNIQRFDFDELEELSDMSEDNFIEFDLSKEGAIDLFNELVKTYLHDKAISEVVDDGESLRIDLNPPKIKFERVYRAYIPVWEGVYTSEGKQFPFVINGRIGDIDGDYRRDYKMLQFFLISVVLVIIILILLQKV